MVDPKDKDTREKETREKDSLRKQIVDIIVNCLLTNTSLPSEKELVERLGVADLDCGSCCRG